MRPSTVGHGCEGAATVAVRVQIPDGVVSVKPMPKPGWQLETRVEPYSQPVEAAHGETYTEGVREIAWSGGNLPDDWYDVFSFRVQLPDVNQDQNLFPGRPRMHGRRKSVDRRSGWRGEP